MSINNEASAKQWLFTMMENLSRDGFSKVAFTLWSIWYARRKILHEEEFQCPLSKHLFIESYQRDLSVVSSQLPA